MEEAISEIKKIFPGTQSWKKRGPWANGRWRVSTEVAYMSIHLIGDEDTLEKIVVYFPGDKEGLRFFDLQSLQSWMSEAWKDIGLFLGTIRDI